MERHSLLKFLDTKPAKIVSPNFSKDKSEAKSNACMRKIVYHLSLPDILSLPYFLDCNSTFKALRRSCISICWFCISACQFSSLCISCYWVWTWISNSAKRFSDCSAFFLNFPTMSGTNNNNSLKNKADCVPSQKRQKKAPKTEL